MAISFVDRDVGGRMVYKCPHVFDHYVGKRSLRAVAKCLFCGRVMTKTVFREYCSTMEPFDVRAYLSTMKDRDITCNQGT